MDRATIAVVLLATLVSVEAVAAFPLAEAIRVRFLRRWSRTPPSWRLAWAVGGAVYGINLAALLLDRLAGVQIASPTADVRGAAAVLLYPALALPSWGLVLVARRELMRAHGRDPYAH